MSIAFTRKGSGRPPIAFVHGFGCARGDWDAQVAHLAPAHDTIAVDLGGHGETPATEAHTRIETHGADVAALIGALDLRGAVLVGHSMGCRVVMEVALREPARVAGLVLVDGSRMGAPGAKDHLELAKHIRTIGYEAFVRPVFASMFSNGFPKALSQPVIDRAAARRPEIAGALFPDIRRWDSERMDDVLASIRVPVLAIQTTRIDDTGARVSMRPGDTSPYLDLLRTRLPTIEVEVITGIGHFPQLETPEAVNGMIARFAARVAGGG